MEIQKTPSAPVSVRMTQETNERFKELTSGFGFANQNQAMEGLIAAFELQQARNLIPSRAKEIEEFADHAKRLNDIYLNALELNINTEDFIRKEYSNKLETQQNVISSQQEQLATAKLTITDLTAQLKESQKTIMESEKSLRAAESQASTQSQLIAEYKEKNETLTSMITKNQTLLDQAELLKTEFVNIKNEHQDQVNKLIKENEQAIKQLNNEIDTLQSQNAKEIAKLNLQLEQAASNAERLVDKHQAAMERSKDQSEVAIEKLTNKLQSEYQANLQIERDRYNKLQADHQDQLQEIRDRHNKQVAELLQKLQPQITTK